MTHITHILNDWENRCVLHMALRKYIGDALSHMLPFMGMQNLAYMLAFAYTY
jgi:hypothetical protein